MAKKNHAQPNDPQPSVGKIYPGGLSEKDLKRLNKGFLGVFWTPPITFGLLTVALALGLLGMLTPRPEAPLATQEVAPSSTPFKLTPRPTITSTSTTTASLTMTVTASSTLVPTQEVTLGPTSDTPTPLPTETPTPAGIVSPTITLTPLVDMDKDGITDFEEKELGTNPEVSNLRIVSNETEFYNSKDIQINDRVAEAVNGNPIVFLIDEKDVLNTSTVEVLIDVAIEIHALGQETCIADQKVTLNSGTRVIGVDASGEIFSIEVTSPLNAKVLGTTKDGLCKLRIDVYINASEISELSDEI